jgi:carbon monoxide dehydrogenase subunit G
LQVKGEATLPAPRSRVWATLLNADSLQACLPGVQRFEPTGEGQWDATVTVGVAGIKGTYTGKVTIADQQPETSYRLTAEGSGGGNRIKGTALITLADAPDGGTVVSWEGDAQIAGTLALVGQRLLQPASRMMADQFFKCMGSKVTQ